MDPDEAKPWFLQRFLAIPILRRPKTQCWYFCYFFFEIDQSKKAKRSRGRKCRAEKAFTGLKSGFQNGSGSKVRKKLG